MQVNVKELTGVLHLSLVFMIVLVLQSFLAVSLQVCCANYSKLPAVTSVLQVWEVLWAPGATPLLSTSRVWFIFPVVYSKLPVYRLLALSMAEAVMVHSLDLMDSYYMLSVSPSH